MLITCLCKLQSLEQDQRKEPCWAGHLVGGCRGHGRSPPRKAQLMVDLRPWALAQTITFTSASSPAQEPKVCGSQTGCLTHAPKVRILGWVCPKREQGLLLPVP